jgi:hypothetical protein
VPDYQIDVLLAERKSLLISHAAQSLESDAVLVRKWDNVPNGFLDDIASEVRSRRTETNPEADLKTFTGTWRIAKVEITRGTQNDRSGSIEETLALGLLTTLPESEARVSNITASPQTGAFALTRSWVYVDPAATDTLVPALNAIQSVTNPTGDGETFTGLFTSGGVTETENDDGSVTVSQTLFKVVRAEVFGDLYAMDASDIRTQTEQVHPFDTDGDYGVYEVVQTVDRQINTFKNLYVYDRAVIDAFTPTQFTSLAPAGFAFLSKDLKEEDNGTLTLEVVFQDITDKDIYLTHTTRQAALGTATTDVYLEQGNDTPLDTSGDTGQGNIVTSDVTRREDGKFDKKKDVATSVAATAQFRNSSTIFREGTAILYENSRTAIVAPLSTGQGIYQVSQRLNDDGTYSGQLTYDKGLGDAEAVFASESSALGAGDTVIYKDAIAPVNSPPSTQGNVYSVTNSLTERGTYDARLVYQESVADSVQFRSSSTLFREGNSIVYENSRTSISAPVATGSGIYSVSQRLNEDGTYSGTLVYEEGLSAGEAEFDSRKSALSSDKAVIYRSRSAQVDAPTSAQGAVYDVTNSLGDDGLYDARLVYEESIADTVQFRRSSTLFREGNSILYENSRTPIAAPAATGSGSYDVSQRLNEDGTYSGQLTYESGTGAGAFKFDSRESSLGVADSVVYRSATAAVDAPASGQGAIYDASNRLGDDGLYDSTLVYAVSSAGVAQFKSTATRFVSGNTILYENSRTLIAAPASVSGSGVYRVSQSINQDGTYTGSLVYEDGTNAGEAKFGSSQSTLASADTVIYRERQSVVDAPSSGQGAVYSTTNSLTERGTYDARLVYEESVSKATQFKSNVTTFRDANTILYDNSRTKIEPPAAVTGSGIYSVSQRLNNDGTYSGSLVYENGLNSGEAEFASRNSALSNDNAVIYRSRTAQVGAPASVQGAVYDATNSLGDDGLYDSRLVYEESIADTVEFQSATTKFITGNTILYENSRAVIAAPSSVAGSGVYRVSQRLNEDGTYSGSLVYEDGTNNGTDLFMSRESTLANADTVIYKDRQSSVDTPLSAQGVIYSATNTLTDRGTYDARLVYDVSVAKSFGFKSQSTLFKDANSIVYENNRAIIEAPASTSGLYSVTQRINADGTYSGVLVYQVGLDAGEAAFQSRNSALSDDDSIIYKGRTAQVDAPASVQGAIYNTSNSLGEDGLYDAQLVYQKSTADTVAFLASNGPFNTSSQLLYENSRAAITAPSSTFGVYRVSQRMNEDGTYSGSLVYSSSSNDAQALFPSLRSTLQDNDSILYRDRSEIIEAQTSTAGGIYAASNSLNERGLYDGSLVYQKSAAESVGFVSRRTPFTKSDQVIYENNAAKISAPTTTLGVYTVSQRINQDGTYTGNMVYNNPVAGGEARFESQDSTLAHSTDVVYNSSSIPVPAGTAAQGHTYNTTNVLSDDGMYNGRMVYRASKAANTLFSSSEGPLGTSESILYDNSATKINPPSGVDGLYTATQRLNDDGTYSGSITYRKGTPASIERTWLSDNQDIYLYVSRNQEDVTIPSVSVYNNNSLSISIKDDGTYDTIFKSVDNDKFGGIPSGSFSTTDSIYLYARHPPAYVSFSKAWVRSANAARDFAQGTASALPYGTSWKKVVDSVGKYNTNWGKGSADTWVASRVEMY